MIMGRFAVAAVGAALVGSPAAASLVDISQPGTTLQDVIDGGGQFRVADKLFTVTDFFSVAFDASAIGITELDFGLAGRGFRLTDAWADVPGDSLASDFTLSYMVEVVDDPNTAVDESNFRIVDNRLDFDGFATGVGSFARVDETVLDELGNFLGEKSVFANGDGTSQFEDRIDFGLPGFSKLNIVKDAQFFAPLAGGTAGASFIDQTFSQIPAPSTFAIAGVLLLGSSARRR
jgi:hypothetical protein